MSDRFELIVLGSGPAGTAAIETAYELGCKHMAVVEAARRLGGECPNTGCVPTKALLRSVEVLRLARRGREFGLSIPEVHPDVAAIMKRKQKIVDRATGNGRMERIFDNLGAELLHGKARFVSDDTIKVMGREYQADAFIVATGSINAIPPIEGLEDAGYDTFESLVEKTEIPRSMIVIGGGPIGCEWAQILAPLGCKVAIVEFQKHILPREEEEIAEAVRQSFMKQGIETFSSYKSTKVQKSGETYEVTIEPAEGGDNKILKAETLMLSTGQRPAIDGLGLDEAGVELNQKKKPIMNEYLQTSNPKIYFAGDVSATMMFTHVAHEQGNIATANALKGNKKKNDLSVVPRGTFVFPEVGSVGMTEAQARDSGADVVIGRTSYSGISKPFLTGERDGIVKLIVDRKSMKVLGGHIVGHSAAEMIHEIALAMYAKIPITTIAEMIHAYPTLSEAVGVAAFDAVNELKTKKK